MHDPDPHREIHRIHRGGWLRAMVLGANDGIVSTSCLVLGVSAADSALAPVLTAGIAGLVAGALSMAVGEFVSVGSQKDTEAADIALEAEELASNPEKEREELTEIFIAKGLSPELARRVADELSEKDVLKVHLAEELGITELSRARPFQAASSSAVSFALGAAVPILGVALSPAGLRLWVTAFVSMLALGVLGAAAARLGGARPFPATVRVVIGGIAAMALTMGIGKLVGTSLG